MDGAPLFQDKVVMLDIYSGWRTVFHCVEYGFALIYTEDVLFFYILWSTLHHYVSNNQSDT